MIKYAVHEADSADKLAHKINSLTGKGWAVTGGVTVLPKPGMHSGMLFFQAMTKETTE